MPRVRGVGRKFIEAHAWSMVGGVKLVGEAELEHCHCKGPSYDSILQGSVQLGWPFRAVPP